MDATRPTIVVGIGEAGWRMVDDISTVAREQLGGAEAAFDYIILDTNDGDMMDEGPTDVAYPITIDKPPVESDWDNDVEEFHYLSEEIERLSDGATGAIKRRAIGRYHLEKMGQKEAMRAELSQRIDDHLSDVDDLGRDDVQSTENLSIWVVNSLGGGTGSGTFPIVTETLSQITSDSLDDRNTYLFGIGGTPETEVGPDGRATVPEPEHRLNTYTALRELEQMIGDVGSGRVTRDVGNPDASFDEEEIDEPFDRYFMLGHDLEEDTQRYLNQINRVAGILITYLSQVSALEDFPPGDIPDRTLWAIDAYQVHVPVTDSGNRQQTSRSSIEAIVDSMDDIEEARAEIDDLEKEQERLEDAREFVRDLNPEERNFDSFSPEDIADRTSIRADLLTNISNKTSELSESNFYSEDGKIFEVDAEIERLLDDETVTAHIPDTDEDTQRSIVQLVYCSYLSNRVEDIEINHEFDDAIEDEWGRLREGDHIDVNTNQKGRFNEYGSDPLTAYREKVKSALTDIKEDYEEKAEEQGSVTGLVAKTPVLKDYEAAAADLDRKLTRLEDLENEYAILQQVAETASSRTATAWDELEAAIDRLGTQVTEKSAGIDERQNTIRQELKDIRRTIATIRVGATEDRYYRIPITGVDYPDEDDQPDEDEILDTADDLVKVYNANESIVDVLEDNIESDDLVQALDGVTDTLDAPTVQNEDTHQVNNLLGIATGAENIADDVFGLNITAEKTIKNKFVTEFDEFHQEDLVVASDDGFSLWLLGLYNDLALEKMHEYNHVHDHFVDDDRRVSDTLLGRRHDVVDDEEVATRFAYPEFLDEDAEERIRKKAGMDPE